MVGYLFATAAEAKSPDCIIGNNSHPQTCKSSPLCPRCNSNRVHREGFRKTFFGEKIRRWSCNNCGMRFSDPTQLQKVRADLEILEDKITKATAHTLSSSQVCVTETKNLTAEQTTINVPRRNEEENRGKIVEHAFWMQKEGYAESTISRRVRLLGTLANKGANLKDPESVKETIAKQQKWNLKTKEIAVETYDCLMKMQGLAWSKPKYKAVRKLPFIPTEAEINDLIAGSNKKTSVFLQLLKETGMRCGEAFMLKWTDFDFENRTVNITPEKGSEPRQLRISPQLISMLNSLPRKRRNIRLQQPTLLKILPRPKSKSRKQTQKRPHPQNHFPHL